MKNINVQYLNFNLLMTFILLYLGDMITTTIGIAIGLEEWNNLYQGQYAILINIGVHLFLIILILILYLRLGKFSDKLLDSKIISFFLFVKIIFFTYVLINNNILIATF